MTDLITAARAKFIPRLSGCEASYLAVLISVASKIAVRWCNREFDSKERTELYDGDGSDSLLLKCFPVSSIKTITWITDEKTDIPADCLSTDSGIGEIRFNPYADGDSPVSVFPEGFQNIEIVYTAGFSPIPDDVQEAVAQIVAAIFDSNSKQTQIKSESLGDYSASYVDSTSFSLPQFAKSLLAPYRNMRA